MDPPTPYSLVTDFLPSKGQLAWKRSGLPEQEGKMEGASGPSDWITPPLEGLPSGLDVYNNHHHLLFFSREEATGRERN